MGVPTNKPGVEQVLDMINEANDLRLTTALVTVGTPLPADPEAAMNTYVTIYPGPLLPGMKEPKQVNYRRIDLALLFGANFVELVAEEQNFNNAHSLLDALNTKYGVILRNEDIINYIFDPDDQSPWPRRYTLQAASNSYVYIGEFVVTVTEGG